MKIYIITTECYDYEYNSVEIFKNAFTSKKEAEEAAEKLDMLRSVKPVEITDEMLDIYPDIDFEWEEYTRDKQELRDRPQNDKEAVQKFDSFYNAEFIKFDIQYYEDNGINMTEELFHKIEEWDNQSYYNYEPSKVVELELNA
jgi:hypothetical protein